MTFLSEGVRSPSWAARAWVLSSTHPRLYPQRPAIPEEVEKVVAFILVPGKEVALLVTTSKLVSKWHHRWDKSPKSGEPRAWSTEPWFRRDPWSKPGSTSRPGLVLAIFLGVTDGFRPPHPRSGNAAPKTSHLSSTPRQARQEGHTPVADRRTEPVGTLKEARRESGASS